MSVKNKYLALVLVVIVWYLSAMKCTGQDNYISEIKDWHQNRVERLKTPGSWLSLVGLFWLSEGKNTFGSSSQTDLRFPPGTPPLMGTFILEDTSLTLIPEGNVVLNLQGRRITTPLYLSAIDGINESLHYDNLQFYPITRGGRTGIRLIDSQHPAMASFDTVPYFPIDSVWKIQAQLEPSSDEDSIEIANVVGMQIKYRPAGRLHFEYQGQSMTLTALEGGEDQYFVIFSDQTTGAETYGGGRYIYVSHAGSDGKTWIDFNKSYNPPCVFTEFATCPLPPPENDLPIAITAGELYDGH